MARLARGEYLDPQTIQIVHVTSRCVRRAFLCGDDPYSGKSYDHRRDWIRERLEFLASVFAIDCLTFAVMNNHIHLILRSRSDIVRNWTDTEVVERWLRLCPPRSNGKTTEPAESDVAMITNDPSQVAELRIRLSDISWWMRFTAQQIAQKANREDNCTGRFWEGRYKAQLLLDEAAILACAIYVDLNPIRAAIAQSLEGSDFTGAKARADDLKESNFVLTKSGTDKLNLTEQSAGTLNSRPKNGSARKSAPRSPSRQSNSRRRPKSTCRWERGRGRQESGWLSPLEIKEASDPIGPDTSQCGRRASLKGFLTMSVLRYLELLDWTGRQQRSDKRGAIPEKVASILGRLGIDPDHWLDLSQQFGRLFKRAAGSSISLSTEAIHRKQDWLQAPGASCFV